MASKIKTWRISERLGNCLESNRVSNGFVGLNPMFSANKNKGKYKMVTMLDLLKQENILFNGNETVVCKTHILLDLINKYMNQYYR